MSSSSGEERPRVLILGGCGFIGRHLISHLLAQDPPTHSFLACADKALPAMSRMTPEELALFTDDAGLADAAGRRCLFHQANLASPASIAKAMALGGESSGFDVVVNLASETRYGLADDVYAERCVAISRRCAEAAAAGQRKCRFVEVSTAQVYAPDASKKGPCAEAAELKPWTGLARAKQAAEEALASVSGLEYAVLRPAVVYGPGDVAGLMPRVICAAVYRHLAQQMKFLWTKSLQLNTVHVRDLARAIWHIATFASLRSGDVFNVADKGDTDQGKVNEALEKIFGIKTGFQGTMMSTMASKISMDSVAAEANERHMGPWHEICKEAGIDTVLSPFIDQELLFKTPLRVSGAKLESTGFTYEIPELTSDTLAEQLHAAIKIGIFPDVFAMEPGAGSGKKKD